MRGARALLLMLAASTAACGPRVSKWIYVYDCTPPHAPIQGARVYVQEMYVEEGGREVPYTLGREAGGGDTNAQGMTWSGFSGTRRSVAKVIVQHQDGTASTAEVNRQPTHRIPAYPRDTIQLCAYR